MTVIAFDVTNRQTAALGATRCLPPRLRAVAEPARVVPARAALIRRWMVLLAVITAVLVGASWATASAVGERTQTRVITVQAGETLSQIAARELPGQASRAAVTEILLANSLQSSTIQPGQQLVIPAR